MFTEHCMSTERIYFGCDFLEVGVPVDIRWEFDGRISTWMARNWVRFCGLPAMFTQKVPDDGMCGKTDEERFGFTYAEADDYLEGKLVDAEVTRKIVKMHEAARHKNCVFIPHYWQTDDAMFNNCCCST